MFSSKFIVFSSKFIVFSSKFVMFSSKFIMFSSKFIMFSSKFIVFSSKFIMFYSNVCSDSGEHFAAGLIVFYSREHFTTIQHLQVYLCYTEENTLHVYMCS